MGNERGPGGLSTDRWLVAAVAAAVLAAAGVGMFSSAATPSPRPPAATPATGR